MSTIAASRRYSILVTTSGDDRGTWHAVTAPSLAEALRGARIGGPWQAAGVGDAPEQARVSAIECLGLLAH